MFISKINQSVFKSYNLNQKPQKSDVTFQGVSPKNIKQGAKIAATALMPITVLTTAALNKPANKSTNIVKTTDFNSVYTYELADMLMMSSPAVYYNFEKGKLVKNEHGKFSLSNPSNIDFIEKYSDNIKTIYENASNEDLECFVDNLKKLLKNRVSENVYTVASELYNDREAFSGYLKYSLSNIVDFKSLNELQIKMLSVVFEEMIIDELNSDVRKQSAYYESDKKLDIVLYKHLLDELNFRNGNLSETIEDEVDAVAESEEVDISEIKISNKLNEILEKSRQDYAKEIESYKTVLSQKVDTLADAYMQYYFIAASKNYYDIKKFNNRMLKKGAAFETDERKITCFVEKILSKTNSPLFELSPNYKSWKKDYMPDNASEVISDLLNKYGEFLMSKICTEETLNELQKANPAIKVEMQDLEDIVCEKFDL